MQIYAIVVVNSPIPNVYLGYGMRYRIYNYTWYYYVKEGYINLSTINCDI